MRATVAVAVAVGRTFSRAASPRVKSAMRRAAATSTTPPLPELPCTLSASWEWVSRAQRQPQQRSKKASRRRLRRVGSGGPPQNRLMCNGRQSRLLLSSQRPSVLRLALHTQQRCSQHPRARVVSAPRSTTQICGPSPKQLLPLICDPFGKCCASTISRRKFAGYIRYDSVVAHSLHMRLLLLLL